MVQRYFPLQFRQTLQLIEPTGNLRRKSTIVNTHPDQEPTLTRGQVKKFLWDKHSSLLNPLVIYKENLLLLIRTQTRSLPLQWSKQKKITLGHTLQLNKLVCNLTKKLMIVNTRPDQELTLTVEQAKKITFGHTLQLNEPVLIYKK